MFHFGDTSSLMSNDDNNTASISNGADGSIFPGFSFAPNGSIIFAPDMGGGARDGGDKNTTAATTWLLAEWMFDLTVKQLFYCLFYSTISLAALGGNGIIIYMIANFKQMRTVTNYFIMNLAVGDLLMAVLCIPFTFTSNFLFHAWPFGLAMCRVVAYAQAVSVFISAYTLVAISIDRYIAIIYPLRPRLTRRHSLYAIAFVWLVSLLTPLPTALFSQLSVINASPAVTLDNLNTNDTTYFIDVVVEDRNNNNYLDLVGENGSQSTTTTTTTTTHSSVAFNQTVSEHSLLKLLTSTPSPSPSVSAIEDINLVEKYNCIEEWNPDHYKTYYSLILMILQYWLPFTVLVFTYTRIGLVVWGKQTPGEAHDGRDARIAASKRKMVKMMITCVLAFTMCWLPFNLLILLGDLNPDVWNHDYIDLIYFACHWLAMSHASYNPIIYIRMNARFRYGFRYVLHQCLPCLGWRQRSGTPAAHDHNGHIFNTQTPGGGAGGGGGGAGPRSMRINSNRCSTYDSSHTVMCQMTTMVVHNRGRENGNGSANGDGFDSSPLNDFPPPAKRDNFLRVCSFKKSSTNNNNSSNNSNGNKTNQL